MSALHYKGLDLTPFSLAMGFGILSFASIMAFGWEKLKQPVSILSVSLLSFWLWLGLTVIWSQVPYISAINFWAVGGLPILFFGYLLSPEPEALWKGILPFLASIGLLLCGYGFYEHLAYERLPQAVFANRNNLAAYLNLTALLIGAWFLTRKRPTGARQDLLLWAAAATLGLHFSIISLIGSRGAYIGLLAGLGLLCGVAFRQAVPWKRILALPALLAGAFAGASLLSGGGAGSRVASLADPMTAGSSRFVIWESAWRMWQETPWYGTGIGAFWFGWQPFRAPKESTAGFFAHNDYLQILIEAGWPGLILLLAVMGAALWLLFRALAHPDIEASKKVELTGALAGVGAVALHTFFTFNFYILPILILCGLALGRFHFLAAPAASRSIEVRPSRYLSRPIYRVLVLLLALFPLSYFASVGLSYHNYTSGIEELQKGNYEQSDERLKKAVRYWDAPDVVWFSRADLYRQALQRLSADDQGERETLFRKAGEYLEKAQARNPYRPRIYTIRGQLLQENPDLAGDNWKDAAKKSFEKALQVDPRHIPARVALAGLQVEAGNTETALHTLEQGIAYAYDPETPQLPSYLKFLEELRTRTGDREGARKITERIEALRTRLTMKP